MRTSLFHKSQISLKYPIGQDYPVGETHARTTHHSYARGKSP
jgi:hypothetical protein